MFNKEAFEALHKATIETHMKQGDGPSDGIVLCHSTLKYLASEFTKDKPKDPAAWFAEFYKSCFEAKSLSGFASNASAAAKACGFKESAKPQVFGGF